MIIDHEYRGSYLDCNATTPIEQQVAEVVRFYTEQEFGNAGSRTHEFGSMAKRAVQKAREQVSSIIDGVEASDVIFTSGATESNNISILGLLKWAKENGKKHIVTSAFEHKAVLEPVAYAESLGFEVTYLGADTSGTVSVEEVLSAVKNDTFLVSLMHVNNETGIIQPIARVADNLPSKGCYFHVDAAQGFGKEFELINHPRVDLISVSGHKIYGPKGVGALLMRRRKFKRAPLSPIFFGGGQERGLRPGTLPVPLVAGLGEAASLCKVDDVKRFESNRIFREHLFAAISRFDFQINGDPLLSVPNAVNLSFRGINSEALMLAFKGIAAFSNGSACTAQSFVPSHVLSAMGLPEERVQSAIRLSWCHMTQEPDWGKFQQAIYSLL